MPMPPEFDRRTPEPKDIILFMERNEKGIYVWTGRTAEVTITGRSWIDEMIRPMMHYPFNE